MRPSTCSKCIFYEFNPQDLSKGHCLRYPPIAGAFATPRGPAEYVATPEVKAGRASCGEFQEREFGPATLGPAERLANGGAA